MLVKICGITSAEDLKMCLREGADIAGFNLYPKSTRCVELEELKRLTELAGKKSAVVTVNRDLADLLEIVGESSPGYIQLHGSEDLDYMRAFREKHPAVKIIKKVTVDERLKYKKILRAAHYLLCDAKSPLHGGTGVAFDWSRLEEIPPELKRKLFVAGGITAGSAGRLRGRGVAGVDVASGSESAPGIKDPLKVRKIIEAVKGPRKEN